MPNRQCKVGDQICLLSGRSEGNQAARLLRFVKRAASHSAYDCANKPITALRTNEHEGANKARHDAHNSCKLHS